MVCGTAWRHLFLLNVADSRQTILESLAVHVLDTKFTAFLSALLFALQGDARNSWTLPTGCNGATH